MRVRSEQQLNTSQFPTWCAGCGDFGIWAALKRAVVELGIPWNKLVVVYGIGCSGNMASFLKVYGFHGLHGRAIPVAEGIKLANHKLKVIVVGGDGDLLGEGLNHLVQGCRANHDISVVLHNNQIYGLTTGQSSPTSLRGSKSKSYPMGVIDEPINAVQQVILSGATQVARGFAGDIPHLGEMMKAALTHRGFSFLEVLQPCVTFNKLNTYEWFRARVAKMEKREESKAAALLKGVWTNERIWLGEFWREEKATFDEGWPQLKEGTLIQRQPVKVDLVKWLEKHR